MREKQTKQKQGKKNQRKSQRTPASPSSSEHKFTDERKQKKQRTSGRRITLGKEKRKKQRNRGQENKQRLYRGEEILASHYTFIIVFFQTSASRHSGCTTFPPSPRTNRRKGNPGHTERERPRKTGKNTAKQGKGRREEDRETRNPQTKAPASPTASSSPAPTSKTRGRS